MWQVSTISLLARRLLVAVLCLQFFGLNNLAASLAEDRYLEIPGESHNTGLGVESSDARHAEALQSELLHFVAAPPSQPPPRLHEYIEFSEQRLELRAGVSWYKNWAGKIKPEPATAEEAWRSLDLYAARPSELDILIDSPSQLRVEISPEGQLFLTNEEGAFTPNSRKGTRTLARHFFSRYQVLAFTYDKDLLVFIDAQGRILAVDMALAQKTVFQVPVPIFRVGQLPTPIVEGFGQQGSAAALAADFIDRERPPIQNLFFHEHAIYPFELKAYSNAEVYAGDLVVRDQRGVILGWYDRQQIAARVGLAELVLGVQAFFVAPNSQHLGMTEILDALAQNPQVQAALQDERPVRDDFLRRFLELLPADAVKQMLLLGDQRNQLAGAPKRDITERMTLDEWAEAFAKLQEAGQGATAMETSWRDLGTRLLGVRRHLTRENIRRVAYVSLFAASGASLYWLGHEPDLLAATVGPHGLPWLIHLTNMAADFLIPEALANLGYQLKGTPYWIPLTVHLLTFLSFPTALRFLAQYFAHRRGWHFTRALTTAGMRIDAFFNYPLLHGIARLMLQKRVLQAMRQGIVPWTSIAPDSEVGRALGLTQRLWPSWTGWREVVNKPTALAPVTQAKERALELLAQQKSRRDLAAWLLANVVVSESMQVDLATLKILFEKGQVLLSPAEMRSPPFLKKWEETAAHLRLVLNDFEELGVIPLAEVDEAQLARYFTTAKAVAQTLRMQPGFRVERELLRKRWRQAMSKVARHVAEFGVEENRFLRSAEADKFVAREHWQQLKTDMRFSTVFISLWGGRADFSQPERLAADPEGPMMTNRTHFADLVESGLIYAVSAAASMALVYQNAESKSHDGIGQIDRRYSPSADREAEKFAEHEDEFFSALQQWLKNGVNLPKAAYGEFFWRGILKQIRTAQGYFVRGALVRLAVGGQSLELASAALAYTWLAGKITFGWPWLLVNRVDHLYTHELEGQRRQVSQLRRKLLVALREQDGVALQAGLNEMLELYRAHPQRPLVELLRNVADSLGEQDVVQNWDPRRLGHYVETLSNIYVALEKRDMQKLAELYARFLKEYPEVDELHRDDLTQAPNLEARARALLVLSERYAPLPTLFNRGLHRSVLLAAASLCAYWASFMFADSYHLERSELVERLGEALIFVPATYVVIIGGDRALRRAWQERWGILFAAVLQLRILSVKTQAGIGQPILTRGVREKWHMRDFLRNDQQEMPAGPRDQGYSTGRNCAGIF